MDYYTCRNCGWYFTKKHRIIPNFCPNCKEKSYITNIDKNSYINWLNVYKYSQKFAERQDEKYADLIWRKCCMVWEYYEKNHK